MASLCRSLRPLLGVAGSATSKQGPLHASMWIIKTQPARNFSHCARNFSWFARNFSLLRQVFPNRAHPAVLMARNFSAGATQDEKQAEKLAEKQRQEEEKERLKAEKAQKKLEEKAAKAEYRAQLKAQKEEEKKLLKEEKARIKAAEAEQKKKATAARKREREEKREAKEAEKRMKKQKQELPKIAVKSSVSRLYKRCLQVARRVPDPSWQSTMTSYIRSSFRERTNTPLPLKVSQGHAELKDFEEMLERSKLDKAARKAEMRKW